MDLAGASRYGERESAHVRSSLIGIVNLHHGTPLLSIRYRTVAMHGGGGGGGGC